MRLWICEFCGKWEFKNVKMRFSNVNFWKNSRFLPQCDPIVCTVLCIDETKIIWYFFVDLRLPFYKVLMHFYETFYHQKNLFCSMLTGEVHISSKPKPRLESDWCISFREVAVCFLILCVVMQNRIFFCTEKWEERVWRKCYPSTRKFGCGPFDVKKRARVFSINGSYLYRKRHK